MRKSWIALGIAGLMISPLFQSEVVGQIQEREQIVEHLTFYRTTKIDGLSIFYREAGPKGGPTLLLLHGLPSSSRMFEPLISRLSDRYHLIAPDYPGFGHSDWPDPKKFAYTFDHIAEIMNHFTEVLGLPRYTLYMQDYGVPVGFRMALAHPDRVEALIVQDGVAHNEGLGANWRTRREFWKDRAFEWLERARGQRDPGLAGLRKDPLLTNLQDDPRWNAFLHTMGLAGDQLKTSGL